jgi:hypothetical protein
MAKTKIPATPEEAYALLDAKLTADEKNKLLQAEDSTDFHFGLGLWIRNNWIYPDNGVNCSRFFGEDNWFVDPDDFSDELKMFFMFVVNYNAPVLISVYVLTINCL